MKKKEFVQQKTVVLYTLYTESNLDKHVHSGLNVQGSKWWLRVKDLVIVVIHVMCHGP